MQGGPAANGPAGCGIRAYQANCARLRDIVPGIATRPVVISDMEKMPMCTRTLVLCMTLMLTACDGPTTPPIPTSSPNTTFSLSGQVLTAADTPVSGARVQVAGGTATQTLSVVTDGGGRWTLAGLRGSVSLEAWKPGYFPAAICCPSSHDPLGVTFRLEQGQAIAVGDTVPGRLGLGPNRCSEGIFEAACQIFLLTPEASGEIEIAVTWGDPVDVLLTLATLSVEESAPPAPPGHRALVSSVSAGEAYEIRVASLRNVSAYELKVKARLPGPLSTSAR